MLPLIIYGGLIGLGVVIVVGACLGNPLAWIAIVGIIVYARRP